jgi:hypothetical protein
MVTSANVAGAPSSNAASMITGRAVGVGMVIAFSEWMSLTVDTELFVDHDTAQKKPRRVSR